MKKLICVLLSLTLLLALCACGAAKAPAATEAPAVTEAPAATEEPVQEPETVLFTDSAGREVELPKDIQRIAPSGAVATLILATLAPEKMVCVSGTPDAEQLVYMDARLGELPATGQLYGSKATLNLEQLLATEAQVVIDLGDPKGTIGEDLDALQQQIGLPCVFIQSDVPSMAEAYRTLGALLGLEEKANAIADFIDETVAMAAENSAQIPEAERLSVMYGAGSDGLGTNAQGSSQAQVLELVGAVNAIVVDEVSNKGGGNLINMEQLYVFDPDVIVVTAEGSYDLILSDAAWAQLRAVQDGAVYEIPAYPYNWLSGPPSVNMIFGVWWLGNILYPQVFDYDMTAKTQEMYSLFWSYDMTAEEAAAMLAPPAAQPAA